MNKIIQYSTILLAGCLLLSSCSAPRPRQTLPATSQPTVTSTVHTVWQKEVPASGPALSDRELISRINRSFDPNTPPAERERLMKSIMNSSDHIEGVIRQ